MSNFKRYAVTFEATMQTTVRFIAPEMGRVEFSQFAHEQLEKSLNHSPAFQQECYIHSIEEFDVDDKM